MTCPCFSLVLRTWWASPQISHRKNIRRKLLLRCYLCFYSSAKEIEKLKSCKPNSSEETLRSLSSGKENTWYSGPGNQNKGFIITKNLWSRSSGSQWEVQQLHHNPATVIIKPASVCSPTDWVSETIMDRFLKRETFFLKVQHVRIIHKGMRLKIQLFNKQVSPGGNGFRDCFHFYRKRLWRSEFPRRITSQPLWLCRGCQLRRSKYETFTHQTCKWRARQKSLSSKS